MCNPVAIAIGAAAAGGALKAKAASNQASADSETMEAQARLELKKAVDARQRGAQEAGLARTSGTRAVGEAKAGFAQGNIDVQSGSALDALADTRMASELDVHTIRSNAAREAWGHEQQALIYSRAAKNARKQGRNAVLSSFVGALGSVAGAAGGGK